MQRTIKHFNRKIKIVSRKRTSLGNSAGFRIRIDEKIYDVAELDECKAITYAWKKWLEE